jgi:sugar lactone lactonase YvrE
LVHIEPEVALDARAAAAEGPTWDAPRDRLIWADVLADRVYAYQPDLGRNDLIADGQPVGTAVPRAGGGMVLAVRDGFAFLDEGTGEAELVVPVEADKPQNKMNDGKCDAAGRFWAGTMAHDANPVADAALYRLEPDLSVTRAVDDVNFSNGMAWSPDDRTMYYIDSSAQRVDAFDFDVETGAVENRRPLVEIPIEEGTPDGMTVDDEGFLWVCLWDGWSVRRYSPEGVLDTRIELPVRRVTSCAFGGADFGDLYITTARVGLTPSELDAQPHAGAIFRARPGVKGRPPTPFAG